MTNPPKSMSAFLKYHPFFKIFFIKPLALLFIKIIKGAGCNLKSLHSTPSPSDNESLSGNDENRQSSSEIASIHTPEIIIQYAPGSIEKSQNYSVLSEEEDRESVRNDFVIPKEGSHAYRFLSNPQKYNINTTFIGTRENHFRYCVKNEETSQHVASRVNDLRKQNLNEKRESERNSL